MQLPFADNPRKESCKCINTPLLALLEDEIYRAGERDQRDAWRRHDDCGQLGDGWFSEKMRDRLHGVLADVVVESVSLDGFYNSEDVMARVTQVAGDQVIARRLRWKRPASFTFASRGQVITQPVRIIGVRPEDRAKTGDFGEFLVDDQNRRIAPSFEVSDNSSCKRRPARS